MGGGLSDPSLYLKKSNNWNTYLDTSIGNRLLNIDASLENVNLSPVIINYTTDPDGFEMHPLSTNDSDGILNYGVGNAYISCYIDEFGCSFTRVNSYTNESNMNNFIAMGSTYTFYPGGGAEGGDPSAAYLLLPYIRVNNNMKSYPNDSSKISKNQWLLNGSNAVITPTTSQTWLDEDDSNNEYYVYPNKIYNIYQAPASNTIYLDSSMCKLYASNNVNNLITTINVLGTTVLNFEIKGSGRIVYANGYNDISAPTTNDVTVYCIQWVSLFNQCVYIINKQIYN